METEITKHQDGEKRRIAELKTQLTHDHEQALINARTDAQRAELNN